MRCILLCCNVTRKCKYRLGHTLKELLIVAGIHLQLFNPPKFDKATNGAKFFDN